MQKNLQSRYNKLKLFLKKLKKKKIPKPDLVKLQNTELSVVVRKLLKLEQNTCSRK